MTKETVEVALGERSYSIMMEEGLLEQAGDFLAEYSRVLVVTDENVAQHWLLRLCKALEKCRINAETFILPAGENTKSFAQLEALLEKILATKPERATPLIALGGGVIGDITGFAASIILRGIPFIQIPTTLLAMVDSSVGGKTGINTRYGKNLIGSFYQPEMVLIDSKTLQTLPAREMRAGFAEVIKYGCIEDASFFEWLENNQMNNLPFAIAESCRAKAAIVAEDEREAGKRELLNFGHSFGHALEAECGYGNELLHGEAVAIGMVMAAELSVRLGLCDAKEAVRIKHLLEAVKLPISPMQIKAEWNTERLMARMAQDKKVKSGKIRLILLHAIGQAFVSAEAGEQELRHLWSDYGGK